MADEDELDGVRGGGAGAAGAAVELAEVGEDLGVVGTRERRGDARVLAEVDAVEFGEGEGGGRRGGAGEEGREEEGLPRCADVVAPQVEFLDVAVGAL